MVVWGVVDWEIVVGVCDGGDGLMGLFGVVWANSEKLEIINV